MKKLVIVESPNKVKKIQQFLNNLNKKENEKNDKYVVLSSVGHIRKLSTTGKYGLGIDLETMIPKYSIPRAKKKTIDEIHSNAKEASVVYLATDPDREGESIAWHIKEVIEKKNNPEFKRIIFNEITQNAVEKAIENPLSLDKDLIASQEARRMLDRMIGFRLSFLTKKKIAAKSSGRVKSSVLKLIIDKENEIEKFVPETWFNLEVHYQKDRILKYVNEKFVEVKISEKDELEKIVSKLDVNNFVHKTTKVSKSTTKPPKPLEMATLLMRSFSNLGFSNGITTSVAQSLYEKGLITYPRTDSKRISSVEFIKQVNDYINHYTSSSFNLPQKSKKDSSSQDAHEAIRPVDLEKTPILVKKDLNLREQKLYNLIYKITIQSFMDNAISSTEKYIYDNNNFLFSTSVTKIVTPGFKEIEADYNPDEKSWKVEKVISTTKDKIKVIQHETKPPARYNQSSLIKKMKEEGIGRPSTYSSTTSGLLKFGYIENQKGVLYPTSMGKEVTELLLQNFADIINEKYTSSLETKLDNIAIGKIDSKEFLQEFWKEFEPRVDLADATIERKMPEFLNRKCPEDGGELVYKVSRYGTKFIACLNFPDCKYSESIEKKEVRYIGEKCPDCGNELLIRTSRKSKKDFIGCSAFPKCKYLRNINKNEETKTVNLDDINVKVKILPETEKE